MKYWNRISNNEFSLYGEIVSDAGCKGSDDDICPSDISMMLAQANGEDILLHVNSPGGNVFSGMAIYQQLKGYPGKITAKIEGMAASIASVIVLAADEIIMPKNSYMMVHRALSKTEGNAEQLRKTADTLDRLTGTIMDIYRDNLKLPDEFEDLEEKVNAETWLTANEAAGFFKNIRVTGAEKVFACAGSTEFLGKLPEGLKEVENHVESVENHVEQSAMVYVDEISKKISLGIELLKLELEG